MGKAEQRAEASPDLQVLADWAPEIVWAARDDGCIEYYNRRWSEFGGDTGEDAWERLLHPDDVASWRQGWNAAVSSGEPYEFEHRLWDRSAARYRWFLTRARAARGPSGEVLVWTGIATAIDRHHHQLDELRYANEDLQQFVYSASHDLREPLRMIAVYGQLLQRTLGGSLDAEASQYLEFAIQGSHRMEALVRDLLAYTQAAAIEAETAPDSDATLALQGALARLRPEIEESGAEIAAEPLPSVRARQEHLTEVFHNLLQNALRYRGESAPRISIRAEQKESAWVFSLADNGIGIAPRYHNQIFGVFKRLHAGKNSMGTGIGLAICKKIVERYGGRIWVASEEGRGATFYFTLPAG